MQDSNHSLGASSWKVRAWRRAACRSARGDLGAALKSEIQRLAGGSSTDQEAGRKHELACLRMAPTAWNWPAASSARICSDTSLN